MCVCVCLCVGTLGPLEVCLALPAWAGGHGPMHSGGCARCYVPWLSGAVRFGLMAQARCFRDFVRQHGSRIDGGMPLAEWIVSSCIIGCPWHSHRAKQTSLRLRTFVTEQLPSISQGSITRSLGAFWPWHASVPTPSHEFLPGRAKQKLPLGVRSTPERNRPWAVHLKEILEQGKGCH